jgi:hypothetical protein
MSGSRTDGPVGWNWLQNASKWHYFNADGRPLCGRWLALALTSHATQPHDRDKCATCKRKAP